MPCATHPLPTDLDSSSTLKRSSSLLSIRTLEYTWLLVCALLLAAPTGTWGLTGDEALPELARSLHRVLEALETGLSFVEAHADKANLDGVIGVRLVEGKCYSHPFSVIKSSVDI